MCIEGEHLDSVSNPRAQVDYDLGMEAQPSKEHSVKVSYYPSINSVDELTTTIQYCLLIIAQ